MAHVERLRVYPVKALDGEDVERARVTAGATLAGDREYALFGPDGEPVNGKRTARVHDLSTEMDLGSGVLTVRGDGDERRFALPDDRAAAEAWFSAFFGLEVTIRRDGETGFPDRPSAGPSVISTATVEAVASWYDGVTAEGTRRRLRANVEVGGVEPFWEDRFAGSGAPAMRLGDVRLEGVEPCNRCVVPERDPGTGERDPDFRRRFVERRRETFPAWADPAAFDHHYAVMLIADVPPADRGGVLRVGDPVEVVG